MNEVLTTLNVGKVCWRDVDAEHAVNALLESAAPHAMAGELHLRC